MQNPNGLYFESEPMKPTYECYVIAVILFGLGCMAVTIALVAWPIAAYLAYLNNKDNQKITQNNNQFIIDARNDEFYVPFENAPVCKLSEIVKVNQSQGHYLESHDVLTRLIGALSKEPKREQKLLYNVQVITQNYNKTFESPSREHRDWLYSALNAAVKEINRR